MLKTSKVKECTYTSDWKAPNGSFVYYHNVSFENGDTGVCGRSKKSPQDMLPGVEIEYEINAGKIKYMRPVNQAEPPAPSQQGSNNSNSDQYHSRAPRRRTSYGSQKGGNKHPHEFLGYSFSYAKDLVIAGKASSADVADLKRIAKEIYFNIMDLLDETSD